MATPPRVHAVEGEPPSVPWRRRVPGEDGVWVFTLGDMSIFAIVFGAYMHYRSQDPALFNHSQQALNSVLGVVNTLLLLLSSFFVVLAVSAPTRRSWV